MRSSFKVVTVFSNSTRSIVSSLSRFVLSSKSFNNFSCSNSRSSRDGGVSHAELSPCWQQRRTCNVGNSPIPALLHESILGHDVIYNFARVEECGSDLHSRVKAKTFLKASSWGENINFLKDYE
uniref:Uncharacterized protein n=1 Tax=Timema cristinae TaxID=61476 RepID=A0A7R9D6S1_TIMCR|nr:unnamed protein product [Timema cristinae]